MNITNNKIITDKPNRVYLFTNARNETHISEWISHHLSLGFDKIIIFDHKSIIPIQNIVSNYENRINIIRYNKDGGGIKIPLMWKAVKISIIEQVDWMLYLDADEFLCLNAFQNIKQMLYFFRFADLLAINWLMFGSNYHKNDPEGLIVDNYTKSEPLLDQHVKSFVRPQMVKKIHTPHYYEIYNKSKMICMPNKQLNPPYSFNPTYLSYKEVGAYVAHYIYQSEETYIKRKGLLPADDNGLFRGIDKNIHIHHNKIENTDLKDKYSENIKKILKYVKK